MPFRDCDLSGFALAHVELSKTDSWLLLNPHAQNQLPQHLSVIEPEIPVLEDSPVRVHFGMRGEKGRKTKEGRKAEK